MDSINRNQPEENRDNLQSQEAIEKIKELVEKGQNCFFCTNPSTDQSNGARPMNVRQVDDDGNLWFLMANDSFTFQDLTEDPSVELFFQGSKHSDFLHLKGRITISNDREKLNDLWEPVIKTWFTGGGRRSPNCDHSGRTVRRLLLGYETRQRCGRNENGDRSRAEKNIGRLDRREIESHNSIQKMTFYLRLRVFALNSAEIFGEVKAV